MKTKLMLTSVAGALALLLLGGLGGTPSLRDGRFAVNSVTLNGPATIANGSSAVYTVRANITRDNIGANAVIVGTQGPPPPRVRPAVYSGSTQIGFAEVDTPGGVNTISGTITLSCRNNEVRGDKAGTGHGGRGQFLFWSWDDPAKIKGHLNERESGEFSVRCTNG